MNKTKLNNSMREKEEILNELKIFEESKKKLQKNVSYTDFQKRSLLIQYDLIIGTLQWVLNIK